MNALIERIDELKQFNVPANGCVYRVLEDCKAEIELLESALLPHSVKATLIDSQAKRIAELEEKIATQKVYYESVFEDGAKQIRKAKEYVPMTDDELQRVSAEWQGDDESEYYWERYIEAEVIKRAGLIVKEKDNG